MRKPTVQSLKNKLDKVFSVFVRQRGMRDENNVCVSCGAVHHWKELQAGHFYRRQHLAVRWDPRNCWPQCFACNVWRRGNYASYSHFMWETQGKEVMDELKQLSRQTTKLTRDYLQEMIGKYQES